MSLKASNTDDFRQVLDRLKKSLEEAETASQGTVRQQASRISTGSAALDRLLPERGVCRGTLVEWLACGRGSGASMLALGMARAASHLADAKGMQAGSGAIVVIDSLKRFYAPAAAALGIDPASLILVHPQRRDDEMWALDQVLRCPGVAAVLWWGERLDEVHFRRLQLACETSGSLGLLIRPHTMRGEPSWAELRLLVEPRGETRAETSGGNLQPTSSHSGGRRVRIEVLRCRAAAGASVELEIDDETGEIREAHPLRLAARGTTPPERRKRA